MEEEKGPGKKGENRAEGKYESKCQMEEEEYLEWWGSYDWNQKEQLDDKKREEEERGERKEIGL